MDRDEFPYFGKEEYKKYGETVSKALKGCKISKRKEKAFAEGGIVYEAEKLGLKWTELIACIEGMCYNGIAREIDDSTYLIL